MSAREDLEPAAPAAVATDRPSPAAVHNRLPLAPTFESLPERRERRRRGGAVTVSIPVCLELVTPVLGGASQVRSIDEVDVIRAATIRGHLRFWWRTLHGHEERCTSAADLYRAESDLWGRAATDDGGRSAVDIRIDVVNRGEPDDSPVLLNDSRHGSATKGAYALWPAREPHAPRRKAGTRFRLTLVAPKGDEPVLRSVIRAWLLFGGYGGRTRRGLGSLTVADRKEAANWLPTQATRAALAKLLGRDIFAAPTRGPEVTPWLAGASLLVGGGRGAEDAWTTALGWLRDFRQGSSGAIGDRAREPDPKKDGKRPSLSNWPEADKIRQLTGKTLSHPPRHNRELVWPRAGFGLPILGQFQTEGRHGGMLDEPGKFELRWRSLEGEHDRLASPLIVKALPLADGKFAPCALWLNRGMPAGAEIGLARGTPKVIDGRSVAPFDRLVAPGDTAQFSALAAKTTLREAFLDWLKKRGTTVVAP